MKRLVLGLFVAALGGLLGAGVSRPAAPPGGQLFLSPAGSDASPCTEAAPCLTFGRAYYRVASPGDTVLRDLRRNRPLQLLRPVDPLSARQARQLRVSGRRDVSQRAGDNGRCLELRHLSGRSPVLSQRLPAAAMQRCPTCSSTGSASAESLFAGTATGRIEQALLDVGIVHDLIFRNVEPPRASSSTRCRTPT